MTLSTSDAAEAIAGLVIGGLILTVMGGALASSMSVDPLIDLRLWGVIYILVAIILAVATVFAVARSLLAGI